MKQVCSCFYLLCVSGCRGTDNAFQSAFQRLFKPRGVCDNKASPIGRSVRCTFLCSLCKRERGRIYALVCRRGALLSEPCGVGPNICMYVRVGHRIACVCLCKCVFTLCVREITCPLKQVPHVGSRSCGSHYG